jgi:phosphoribosylcarboxyaminoimidazole (NCAIR) mutase
MLAAHDDAVAKNLNEYRVAQTEQVLAKSDPRST